MSEEIELVEAPEETASEKDTFDFDEGFQKKVLALSLRDQSFASKTFGLIEPGYFEQDVDGALASIALDYYGKYRKAPDISILTTLIKDAVASKRIRKDLVPDIAGRLRDVLKTDLSDRSFVADKVADFARNKAIERAVIASVDLLAKGDIPKIRKMMDEATRVGLDESDDYDYWEQIDARTELRKMRVAGVIKRDGITTGFKELDDELYHHGWGRKELSCIMGAAKAGKSMSLGQFGLNAALAGHNVLYASCEVSRDIIAERLDAAVSEVAMKVMDSKPFEVEKAVKTLRAKAANLAIHEYAAGTLKPSQLRRVIEGYRAKGVIFDLIIPDYADIMAPEHRSDSIIDNMRSIYIDLRAIMFDYNAAGLTATQTNREGAKKAVASATDVAEDFNKARTVDLMLSLNATEAEKAANEARIFFALARNGESDFSLRVKQDRSTMRYITKVLGRS